MKFRLNCAEGFLRLKLQFVFGKDISSIVKLLILPFLLRLSNRAYYNNFIIIN